MTIQKTTLLLLCLALFGCSGGKHYRKMSGSTWGTIYNITYNSPVALDDSIAAVMEQVDASLSMFREGSLVSRINAGDTTVRADALLRRVIETSQTVSRQTHGAFDPTVAPLVEAWGFGRAAITSEPTPADIDSLLKSVGIGRVRIDAEGRVALPHPSTKLDFSAIAKGFGCDLIAEMLRRNGVEDFLVEIGGEVVAGGVNPHGEPWHVMIEDCRGDRGEILELTNQAVATSGNYRNFRETAHGRIGHTISPLTGYPVATSTLSATVVAEKCLTADAYATAAMVLSADSARVLIPERLILQVE